jgi:hypothetical protein
MNKDEIKSLLNKVTDYLNKNYYQSSENYEKIICTDKTNVFTLCDNRCIVSTWQCGAIVSIEKQIFFISEDDGYWFVKNLKDYNGYEYIGCRTGGSALGNATATARALIDLFNYYVSK